MLEALSAGRQCLNFSFLVNSAYIPHISGRISPEFPG